MDYEPISVALKFGFLAVLYLFLFWIAVSARRDLRANRAVEAGGSVGGPISAGGGQRDGWLVVESGEGLSPGQQIDLFGGVSIGRSAQSDVQIGDRYASGLHARVYSRGGRYYVEDMNSTNGTLLNGGAVSGTAELMEGDLIAIGDTSFRVELGG